MANGGNSFGGVRMSVKSIIGWVRISGVLFAAAAFTVFFLADGPLLYIFGLVVPVVPIVLIVICVRMFVFGLTPRKRITFSLLLTLLGIPVLYIIICIPYFIKHGGINPNYEVAMAILFINIVIPCAFVCFVLAHVPLFDNKFMKIKRVT